MVGGMTDCFIITPPKCGSKCVEIAKEKRRFPLACCSRIWYHRENQSDGGIRMNGQENLLDYETIRAATAGEKWATEKVLAH